jgi:Rap1a immunity proteins
MHKPLIVVPILVGLALMAMARATSAAELTGDDVLPACTDFLNKEFQKDPLSQGQCIGVIEALAFAAPNQPFQISRSCPPQGATVGQLTTAVVSWIERRPENLHKPFFALVLFALRDKWPCPS